jgi:adenylate kinase
MNILLIGPQGSGKGTQARLLCDKYDFFYFESGAYLRRMAETHEDVRKMLNEGKLVPDEEMTSYLAAYLDDQNLYDDIIFDGFPRTVVQYNFFKNWLTDKKVKLDLGIVITITEKETIRRLTARRLDPATGKIYNLITEPPSPGVDAEKLVQREDDKPEAIKKRLELYRSQTEPLIEELKRDTTIIELDGERPIKVIFNDISRLIDERINK